MAEQQQTDRKSTSSPSPSAGLHSISSRHPSNQSLDSTRKQQAQQPATEERPHRFSNQYTRSYSPHRTGLGLQDGFHMPNNGTVVGQMPQFARTYSNPLENPPQNDPEKRSLLMSKAMVIWSWIVLIISLGVSILLFYVAVSKQSYGKRIQLNNELDSDYHITPLTARTITNILSKIVEMSIAFLTALVLGQILTRAMAFPKSRGITFNHLLLKEVATQPGSLFGNWGCLKGYVGVFVLLSILTSSLYTIACASIVQPELNLLRPFPKLFEADVKTPFFNHQFHQHRCRLPSMMVNQDDPVVPEICTTIEYAARAYSDFNKYKEAYEKYLTKDGPKPAPVATIHESDTATGALIDFKENQRMTNVTFAMPHSGVYDAVLLKENDLLQPAQLGTEARYVIEASVPSPALNVMCYSLSKEELSPLVLEPKDSSVDVKDFSEWAANVDFSKLNRNEIKTVADDVFQWGKKYDTFPPVFQKFPKAYNTIQNVTFSYGVTGAYILGLTAPPEGPEKDKSKTPYSLCKLSVHLTNRCSTILDARSGGTMMSVNCGNPNPNNYYNSNGPGYDLPEVPSKDWPTIGTHLMQSVALHTGISDAGSSNARMLLTRYDDSARGAKAEYPRMAESLAAMVSASLIVGGFNAPMVPFWNETAPDGATYFNEPVKQYFNVKVEPQEYRSGASHTAQMLWFIVLAAAILINLCYMLYFFLIHHNQERLAVINDLLIWGSRRERDQIDIWEPLDPNATGNIAGSMNNRNSRNSDVPQFARQGSDLESPSNDDTKHHRNRFLADMTAPLTMISIASNSHFSRRMRGSTWRGPDPTQASHVWKVQLDPKSDEWVLKEKENRRMRDSFFTRWKEVLFHPVKEFDDKDERALKLGEGPEAASTQYQPLPRAHAAFHSPTGSSNWGASTYAASPFSPKMFSPQAGGSYTAMPSPYAPTPPAVQTPPPQPVGPQEVTGSGRAPVVVEAQSKTMDRETLGIKTDDPQETSVLVAPGSVTDREGRQMTRPQSMANPIRKFTEYYRSRRREGS